jgi:tetratricopeptide (TPR) repeat protein
LPEHEIDSLRERWEADRSPVLTLQLADEYKARDDSAEALAVLKRGVEAHPNHVATRVAKGRHHLEIGEVDEAAVDLERVAVADPAHLLANKLLVEAYTRLGNLARARDRLGIYSLLSSGDPEVAEMERRLEAAAASPPPAEPTSEQPPVVPEELPGVPAESAESAEEPVAAAEEQPISAGEVPAAAEAPAMTTEELLAAADQPAAPAEAPGEPEPFDLPVASSPQILAVEVAAPSPSPRAPQVEVSAGVEPFGEADWPGLGQAGDSAGLFADGLFTEAPVASPTTETAPPTPDAVVEAAEPAAGEGTESQDLAATMTLAELYRKQGHHEEATGMFREVLERQPGNARAARALQEMARSQGWSLSAEQLLGDSDTTADGTRKGEVLRRYRDRLRPKE